MKYLQLICIEGETGTPEVAAAMSRHIGPWLQETETRGIRIVGKALDDPAGAKTIRVRNGETLVTDGPFAATKEYIGGLDILECDSLDEAIEVAAKHPVSWFHAIELRPFASEVEVPDDLSSDDLQYLVQVFVDGIPEAPEVEEGIVRDAEAWGEQARAHGGMVLGGGLQPKHTATTVRVRDGEVLLTDGPFVETKEYLAGIAILNGSVTEAAAVELAARFPTARFHPVEVRRFIDP
jgi:hypothetical protein